MANEPDPYRTLGLSPGASADDIRRAYRRLAKANHPDSAGEKALPRFLAIQAAYESLESIAGPRRPAARAATARGTPREPWRPDPERARATRESRSGGTDGATGRRRRPSGEEPRPASRGGRNRPSNKATPGSTTYDAAEDEPFEPDWSGGTWYGASSGTYWTINPKEYADPRKHGPEYQARGRRRQSEAGSGAEAAPPIEPADEGEAPDGPAAPETAAAPDTDAGPETDPRRARRSATPPPTHTTASWWEATAGDAPGEVRGDGPARARPRPATADADTLEPLPLTADAALAAIRSWVIDGRPGLVGRLGRAVFGWAPLALAIGWVGGEISGCGRFAATCDPAAGPISWLVELLILILLLAVPRLARIAAIASVTTLVAAISGALVLSAVGSQDYAEAGRTALSGLIVIAWAVGLAVAMAREVRMVARAGPVS